MPDETRLALERALAAVRSAEQALVAALAPSDELVPLKPAADAMRLSEAAARKRAVRGCGVWRDGRWYFPRSYVEARRRA